MSSSPARVREMSVEIATRVDGTDAALKQFPCVTLWHLHISLIVMSHLELTFPSNSNCMMGTSLTTNHQHDKCIRLSEVKQNDNSTF